MISLLIALAVTLAVQVAFVFHKYRFNVSLVLGATLAAINWYEDSVRRKGRLPSRVALVLIATSATATTLVLQQVAPAFAR